MSGAGASETSAPRTACWSRRSDNAADYGNPPVALEMRAGQISLRSDWILHGSEPNRSNRRRCGLAMRYLSADVRACNGWNANSIWCRGTDPGGPWANHSRPHGELIPTPPKTPPQPTPSGKHPSAPTASGNARAGVVKTASGSGDLRVPCRPFGQRSGSHSRTLRFALVVTGGHHLSQPGGDERRVRDTSGEEIRDVRHPTRIGHGQHLDDDVAVVAVSLRGKSSKGEACVGKDGRFEHLQERRGCDLGQMMASKTAPRSQFCTIECGVPVLIAPDTKTLVSSTTRTAPLRLGACFGGRPAPRRQPTPWLARPRGRHRWRRRSRRDRVEHQQSSTPTPHPR